MEQRREKKLAAKIKADAQHQKAKEAKALEAEQEALRALDLKMRECWKAHPQLHVVGNGPGGFGEKLESAAAVVLQLAQETHPVEFARAGNRKAQ